MQFSTERAAILRANPWLPHWTERWPKEHSGTWFSCGWVRGQVVNVVPSRCTQPGRGYSWPGSVSDRTVRGVYFHEIGHIAHGALEDEQGVLRRLRALGGPKVTGYEPNPQETFAETFRLYIGNPALLLAGRPWRFEFMERVVKALPNMPVAWDRGLIGTPPQRFLDQCERWIGRGRTWAAS
jgi:hypothetical protein